MAKSKATISLKESLLEQADALALEIGVSRSQLFSIAVEQFVMRHQNQKILEALNDVFRDGATASEQRLLREVKLKFRQMLEDE